jgi:hypothetical protein
MLTPPVLFLIFNRPANTQKVFEAIRQSQPSRLYIAADAPRPGNRIDEEKCRLTREVTEQIDWPCEVKRLYQEQNLGCSFGPRAAFGWFFSQEPEGIILEDDCVPHPNFFSFAQAMLERYRNDQRILSINGSNLGYQLSNGNSYTYSRFMNMWGWATWADRAKAIDYNLNEWKRVKRPLWFLHSRLKQHAFDADLNWYKYWQHKFDLTITQPVVTWWDWQWIFHQIKNKQFSVVPSINLITNIGFDADATHTFEAANPAANIPTKSMPFPLQHPGRIKLDFVYEEQYVKWVWCYHKRLPKLFYLKQFISSYIKAKN